MSRIWLLAIVIIFFTFFIMANGGKRPGAGRPKGSTNIPQFRDFVSDEDRAEFVEFVLSTYKESERLTMWVGDQIYGKPGQSIALTNPDGSDLFSSLKELSDGELERLAGSGEGGTGEEGTSTS